MHAAARWVVLLGLVLAAPCAFAQMVTTTTGELQGAPWRIDMPAQWNGELVMLAHGLEPKGVAREPSWPANEATPALLAAGYAVAQSGYSQQGWAVAEAVVDTERLRHQFVARHPQTQRSWVLGLSMGGAVAIASLEQHPQHYDGGVSLCGANLPGATLADELLTGLVAFDYFLPKADGLLVESLSSPAAADLPQMQVYQTVAAALQSKPEAAQALAARLQVGPEALAGTLSVYALVLQDLVQRFGGLPVGNQHVVYSGFGDDAAFNAGVKRYLAEPAAHTGIVSRLPLSGALTRPLVIQFNHQDPTIAPRMQSVYPQLAARAGAKPQPEVLPATGEGHCAFSQEQIVGALKAVSQMAASRGGTSP